MRILIADDSLLSRRLLEQTLVGWSYQVTAVSDGEQAWSCLNGPEPPDLAILDWMMPGYTGPELCRLVREKNREPYTYIILLTSRHDKEDVVAGMESGADDYLTKPFDRHELQVRLRAGTRIVELQQQLLTTREALREQATRDYLTKLWNRSAILDFLKREMSRSRRDGTPVGVVMGDIDYLKVINDTWGHGVGDIALKQAAKCMKESLRPYDAVGRYGGEEFLIVLPGTNLADAAWLADRVRLAIRSIKIETPNGGSISVTCSFGVTSGIGGQVNTEELIRTADEGLYAAKRDGRDRVNVLRSTSDVTGASPELIPAVAGFSGLRPETD